MTTASETITTPPPEALDDARTGGLRHLGAMARASLLRPSLAVFLGVFLVLVLSEPAVPYTDDARFYLPAAQSYAGWFERLITGPFQGRFDAYTARGIDQAFENNHEHPPVAKYAMGAAWLVAHRWLGLTDDATACRLGIMALAALLGTLVFSFTRRHAGWVGGLAAVLSLLLMPRFFFEAHAETLDLAVTCFCFATIAAYERSLVTRRARWLAVACFALALGSKLNAPFLLLGFLIHLAWLRRGSFSWRPPYFRIPAVPLSLALMVIGAPLLFVALWPWLWHDTLARLQAYLAFHLHHYGILFYYFGQVFGEQRAPWSAPWVMLGLTTPLPILLAAALAPIIGALPVLTRAAGRFRPRRLPHPTAPAATSPTAPLALVLIQLIIAVGAVSFTPAPVYGGVKLFLPALPCLAVLAGLGIGWLSHALLQAGTLPASTRCARQALVAAAMAAYLAAPLASLVIYRGYYLSYYNELIGGIRGATAAGLERQYYDLAYPDIPRCLTAAPPGAATVAFLPNPKEYSPHVSLWRGQGLLAKPWQLVDAARARVLVLTHERRWASYALLAAQYRAKPVLCELALLGVPMATIYDNRAGD